MVKNLFANAGGLSSILGLGSSPGEGHGNPLPYSCLENPIDRGAWWATVQGVAKIQTRLRMHTNMYEYKKCFLLHNKTKPKHKKQTKTHARNTQETSAGIRHNKVPRISCTVLNEHDNFSTTASCHS